MAPGLGKSLMNLKNTPERIETIVAIASNKQVNEAFNKVVGVSGQTIQKLAAAAKTADPVDDLEAKVTALRDLAANAETEKLTAQHRQTILKDCASYHAGLELVRHLRGKKKKQRVQAFAKQINKEYEDLIEKLTTPTAVEESFDSNE